MIVGCGDNHSIDPDGPPPVTYVLQLQVGGNGSGVVTSAPAGLTCAAGACSAELAEGTQVTLAASASAGAFLGWSGDCSGQGACTVTMDRDRSVGALFGAPGAALWVKQLGGADRDYGRSIAVDSNGDLIAVGAFRGTIAAGPAGAELVSAGGYDVYVQKLDGMTGAVQWARRVGGAADDHVAGVAVDGADNAYVLGSFQGEVDLGGGPLAPTGPTAVFVLALDPDGGYRWARKLDGTNLGAGAGGIASGGGAAVAVVGSYQGSLTVDATTFTSAGASDLFAVELTAAAGATLWARSFGGAGRDLASGVALDGAGNAVLTGMFEGAIDFGGGVLAAPTALNGYVLKLARGGGGYVLARQLVGPKVSQGAAVAIDLAGNVLVTGSFQGSLSLGCGAGLSASQPGQDDVFLAKLSPAGACTWAKAFGGAADGAGASPPRAASAVAVNSAGDVAIAGAFCGSLSLGGPTLASASACPATNAFAARLAGDGAHRRSIRAGGGSGAFAGGVAQAADGRVFVTGDFSGLAEFGGTALTSSGPTDAFIAAFAPQ